LEDLVAADVVSVMVRVQEELDRLVRDFPDFRDDARRDVLELRVHDEHRLRPGKDADVASAAVERVDGPRERLDPEDVLRLTVMVLRSRRRSRLWRRGLKGDLMEWEDGSGYGVTIGTEGGS